jgi:hypothetical protein
MDIFERLRRMDDIGQGGITALLSQINFVKIGMIDNIQLSDIDNSWVTVKVLQQLDFPQTSFGNERLVENVPQFLDGHHCNFTMSSPCRLSPWSPSYLSRSPTFSGLHVDYTANNTIGA